MSVKMSNDDFQFVTYKKSKAKYTKFNHPLQESNHPNVPPEEFVAQFKKCCQRIEEAKLEINQSDLYKSFSASLNESLSILGNRNLCEIVCLGLGKVGDCFISKYQFALLLNLKEKYKCLEIKVTDPVFNNLDEAIITHFNCKVLKDNLEGKYKVECKKLTLFYLPHCPKQLTNNLLWANWGHNLTNCIVVSNSFTYLIENTIKRVLHSNAKFIELISPHMTELPVINSFRYFEIFNDTAIHIFPWDKLKLLPPDFWPYLPEPNYSSADLEFITKKD